MATHEPTPNTGNRSNERSGAGIAGRTALRKVAPINRHDAPTVPVKVARRRVAAGAKRSAFLDELVAASGPDDAAQAELQKSLAERDGLEAKCQKLQAQVAELEHVGRRLSAIEGSTSWRMTYPLRRLMHGTLFVRNTTIELVKLAWRTGTGLRDFGRTRAKAETGPSTESRPVRRLAEALQPTAKKKRERGKLLNSGVYRNCDSLSGGSH
jgi:hypothetical protein